MTRPSSRRISRGVRFNLPLNRQNTQYNPASTSHIPNLTKEQMDIRDEDSVAELLMEEDDERPRKRMHASEFEDPSRPAAPVSLTNTPGPLPLQVVYSALEHMEWVPPDIVPPPVPRAPATHQSTYSSSSSRLKRRRSGFTHPDGTPLSFHFSKAYYNDDEQQYIIPCDSSSSQLQPELRLFITKDWSARKLVKHRENELLIYRVPKEHTLYFGLIVREHGLVGLSIRKPEDDDDEIKVLRHGHPSWDIGYKDETWYLIGKDRHVISHVLTRVSMVKPKMWTRVKRFVWAKTAPVWRMPSRFSGIWS
ncbi:hypothetical protein CPB83DRAFT_830786 [Crepidotus variabilis]|uniref:Uncharacterized protein n=1 Tax=Crepidotus variabilis TaxID=179855 RepID=A0A9P6ER67_9AGAR|nr:hypothetical protein CPB83DRAFT_830786 [Crepidotus variabilis]